jgi:pyruvate/2-oxoglutarate dehydrogenase complex dihydrolipoamide acyltransferase (E2) component
MTQTEERLDRLREQGLFASHTHFLLHATARALAANPDIHQIVAGNKRYRPSQVDIGLSITGEAFVTPVLVIERADQKSVAELVEEITRRVPEARKADLQMLNMLRRWGWILPFGFIRRALLRMLFTSVSFRRKGVGTFQVSVVPVDWSASANFTAAGLLCGGAVRSRVVVIDEKPAVRPIMTLTLCCDHGVWNGRAATQFLSAVKTELEKGTS